MNETYHIGKYIKKRRTELGMSQSELAEKLGYKDKSSICKIESGKSDILQHQIPLFAKILKTTPIFLLGLEETKQDYSEKNALLAAELRSRPDLVELCENYIELPEADANEVLEFTRFKSQHSK